MTSRWLALTLALTACGSATPLPPNAPKPSASTEPVEKFDLIAELEREADDLELQKVTILDGTIDAVVLGSGKPKVETSSEASTAISTVEVMLGGTPMRCTVRQAGLDVGGTFDIAIDNARAKTTVDRAIANVATSGRAGGAFLSVLYSVEAKGGRAAGLYKVGIAFSDWGSVQCEHDRLGYEKSFRRAVLSLADSARVPPPAGFRHLYESFGAMMRGADAIGFSRTRIYEAEGRRIEYEQISRFAFEDVAHVQSTDDATTTVVEKGEILERTHARAQNGKLQQKLVYARRQPGVYAFEHDGVATGTVGLPAKRFAGIVERAKEMREVMEGKKPVVSLPTLDKTPYLVEVRKSADGTLSLASSRGSSACSPDDQGRCKTEALGDGTAMKLLSHVGSLP